MCAEGQGNINVNVRAFAGKASKVIRLDSKRQRTPVGKARQRKAERMQPVGGQNGGPAAAIAKEAACASREKR